MFKTILLFLSVLVAIAFGISKTWYPVKVTNGLYYPKQQSSVELTKDEQFTVAAGGSAEEQFYLLRRGKYLEVLTNDRGTFYLAPELGLFKKVHPDKGFAVGGIYIPSDSKDSAYFWEYSLKFKDRSPINPHINRALSESRDQPDRALFLNPVWYSSKGFTFFGRPMIKTDMAIDRTVILQKK